MEQQRPHVPQFGKWENAQNAAYTVYFDQARKGRGGKLTNPNDPEDNPDILLPRTMDPSPPSPKRKGNQVPSRKGRGRGGSTGSEHSIERSPMHPRGRGQGATATVPVFGEWDLKNPESGEGYTNIFNQVRAEREKGPSNTPGPALGNFNNYNNHHPRNPTSDHSSSHKICCFPW